MRVLIYTGKGGVGKTSVAAATAITLAKAGQRVLIASTDQAHSLADSFEIPLGCDPTAVAPCLDAVEIDAVEECERAWGGIQRYLKTMLTQKSGQSLEAEELLAFPGFEELSALMKIREIYDQDAYDVLIVDCAPTGETLSLLKFPQCFGKCLEAILPMKRKALKVAGPTVEKLLKIPMPEDTIFDDFETLTKRMDRLQNLLLDHCTTSIRIVTTPEAIVLREAQRNFAFLHLYGYQVDAIVVNRIYPQGAMPGYFHGWIDRQAKTLTDIALSFDPLPIFHLELMDHELLGLTALALAGRRLYGDTNPADCFFSGPVFTLTTQHGGWDYAISLPFMDKADLDLTQRGDELHLAIKNQHRTIMLPPTLKNKKVDNARYHDGQLHIHFVAAL